MNWIHPKFLKAQKLQAEGRSSRNAENVRAKGKRKRKDESGKRKDESEVMHGASLRARCEAFFQGSLVSWSQQFAESLEQLAFPPSCSVERSFLWSAVIQEQAEVLARVGVSPQKLASIVSESLSESEDAEGIDQVSDLAQRPLKELANEWLDSIHEFPKSALATIALAWHAVELIEDESWLAEWFSRLNETIVAPIALSQEDALAFLVLRCELPLFLALVTDSKQVTLQEIGRSMDDLAECLERGSEDLSSWTRYGATYFRAALASVLRCRLLADALEVRPWFAPQRTALGKLLVSAARWSRPDGTQLLAVDVNPPKSKAMWAALSELAKPKGLGAVLTLAGVGSGNRSQVKQSVVLDKLPALCEYSEAAGSAVFQSDWRHKGSHVALDCSEKEICLEALGPKGLPMLAGRWTVDVVVEGNRLAQECEWQSVCWFSDEDVDYLELEVHFEGDVRVQRQIALFRESRLLFLADALLAEDVGDLKLTSQLPLASFVEFAPEDKTTEGFLCNSGSQSLVLPLYLPEWKRQLSLENSRSSLTGNEDHLVAEVMLNGRRAYNPVLLSLSASHVKKPYTWRQLTVADELRIVRSDEAQAFRVQIGKEQWFLYRNLDEPIRRTALGMHTMDDFYAGLFDPEDGEFDTLVQVEPSSEGV